MKENVCVDCKYYERCGKPERYMKCMGYEERQPGKTGRKARNGGIANGAGNGKKQGD